ncbi:MAG: hypothetical protein LLG04_10350 [Parachlamydia sp.]|nr:hypothetical protein [Parachlamydia sp.]
MLPALPASAKSGQPPDPSTLVGQKRRGGPETSATTNKVAALAGVDICNGNWSVWSRRPGESIPIPAAPSLLCGHFLQRLDLSKGLNVQEVIILQTLLKQCEINQEVDGQSILWFDKPAASVFTDWTLLEKFVQLLRSPAHQEWIPEKFRNFTHVDITFLPSADKYKVVNQSSLPVWRSSLLGICGDVVLECGNVRIAAYRKFLNDCEIFRPLLAQFPNQQNIPCNGIEPLLLVAGLDTAYATRYPTACSSDNWPKDLLAFLAHAPAWLRDMPKKWWSAQVCRAPDSKSEEFWWQLMEYAEKEGWVALQGCVQPILESFAAKLVDESEPGEKAQHKHLMDKIGPKVNHLCLRLPPSGFGTQLGENFPKLLTLTVADVSYPDPLVNPIRSNSFLVFAFHQHDNGPFSLDCLAGCPNLQELILIAFEQCESISLRSEKQELAPQCLQKLKFLLLDSLKVDEAFVQLVAGLPELESLFLNDPQGLTPDWIRKLAPFKMKNVCIKLRQDDAWTKEKIDALEALGVESLQLAPLTEELRQYAQEKLPNFNPSKSPPKSEYIDEQIQIEYEAL